MSTSTKPPVKVTKSASPPPRPPSGSSGNTGDLPPGVKGWSWGGLFLSCIWAIPNKTYFGLLSLVPIIGLPVPFVLLFKGREWAWRNGSWRSVAHFKRVQRMWSIAGLVFYVLAISALLSARSGIQSVGMDLLDQFRASVGVKPYSAEQERPRAAVEDKSPPLITKKMPIFEGSTDDDFTLNTPLGVVKVKTFGEGENSERRMTLNGQVIVKSDSIFGPKLLHTFHISNTQDVLLMGDFGHGTSCPALLFLMIFEKDMPVRWTPLFGTCSDFGEVEQVGKSLKFTMPKMGGYASYTYVDSVVSDENNKPVTADSGWGDPFK